MPYAFVATMTSEHRISPPSKFAKNGKFSTALASDAMSHASSSSSKYAISNPPGPIRKNS